MIIFHVFGVFLFACVFLRALAFSPLAFSQRNAVAARFVDRRRVLTCINYDGPFVKNINARGVIRGPSHIKQRVVPVSCREKLSLFKSRGDWVGGNWCRVAVQKSRVRRRFAKEKGTCEIQNHRPQRRRQSVTVTPRPVTVRRAAWPRPQIQHGTLRARKRERVPLRELHGGERYAPQCSHFCSS